jgi:putative selenium metabolism hydrolase
MTETLSRDQIIELARSLEGPLIDFCRRLVQTPSPSGDEGRVADLVEAELKALGYDEVWRDKAGNVLGLIRGGTGPVVMFNAHMDHVDPGNPDRWPYPPFGGVIADGYLWGRGACDTKAALAAQVYAGGALKRAGIRPPGDLYVAAVVMEEVGGAGSRHLAANFRPNVGVFGEPSKNRLALGHRGRLELAVRVIGRAAHASVPELALNPHFTLARFILSLPDVERASHPVFGTSSCAPTLYKTDTVETNVIPGEATLFVDWRNVPGESADAVIGRLRKLLERSLEPGAAGTVRLLEVSQQTYAGLHLSFPDEMPDFETPAQNPYARRALRLLASLFPTGAGPVYWRFATDAGHFARVGTVALGFAPGDDTLAHTSEERVGLAELVDGLAGYIALAVGLGGDEGG